MSTTTIQLRSETKAALFRIKNRLEALYGRSLSYDEVISHLVQTSQWDVLAQRSLKEFRGLLGKEGKKVYLQYRKEELAHEK